MKKAVLFLLLVILFIFSLLPPFERDVLLYQLPVPKIWLNFNLASPLFSHFFFYPLLPFLFNYISLTLDAPFIANIFHLLFAMLTLYILHRSINDRKVALFLLLLFATIQPFLRFSYVAYSDFYLTFFSFSALYLVLEAFKRKNNFLLFLSAIMCGLGLNTKYNMLVFALLLYFIVFWLSYRNFRRLKKAFFDTFSYVLISMFLFAPFLIKNYFLTGTPFYPFFTDLFPTTNPFAFKNVSHFLFRKFFFEENLLQILATPIYAFFYGIENNVQFFDGVLNPFFVIFPIIAVFAMKDRILTVLFLFGWLYNYFVLFLEPVSARFLLPSLPIFTYISGEYLKKLELSEKKLWLIFLPFLVFNLFFGGKHLIDRDKWQYLFGKISKEEFLLRKCHDYPAIKFINENTPKGAKIFYLFSGQRTYYLERNFIYDSFNDGRLFKIFLNGAKDEKELSNRLKGEGVSHIFMRKDLFENFLIDNFSDDSLKLIGNFFRYKTRLVYQDKLFYIFELL